MRRSLPYRIFSRSQRTPVFFKENILIRYLCLPCEVSGLLALVVIFLLFLLGGCGPVYRTVYTYQPPQDAQGMHCTMLCENIRMQCRTNETYRIQSCEDENRIAHLEYERCVVMEYDYCWDNWTMFCGMGNYKRCDTDYRLCYQNCGGQIFSREVCVSGCDR